MERNGLTPVQLRELEDHLKRLHNELSDEMLGLSRNIKQPVDRNMIDAAAENEDKEINQIEDMMEENQLHKIETALQKINDNTYGVCEDCGANIPIERLEVIPYALYCVKCEEKREI